MRMREHGGDDGEGADVMRGGVPRWFTTVPRGEISACVAFLRHGGPGASFTTDCQDVSDAARVGVPDPLTSASNLNADLWRAVRNGLRHREDPPTVVKTKAHRSLAAAQRDAVDHVGHWAGNNCADRWAKDLARSMVEHPRLEPIWGDARESATMTLRRLAYGASWALKRWPDIEKRRKPGPRSTQQ